jgi:hypothetical protein
MRALTTDQQRASKFSVRYLVAGDALVPIQEGVQAGNVIAVAGGDLFD